ncbi:MAG: hypothetical protein WDZ40_01245 [Candidatus Spechtbacterales bacterium]
MKRGHEGPRMILFNPPQQRFTVGDTSPITPREERLLRLQTMLRRLNPWTRTGKRAKAIAQEALDMHRPGPRDTGVPSV